jgi:hypothetical protein
LARLFGCNQINKFMIYAIPSIYLALVIIHAKYHAYLIIKKNRVIKSKQKVFEWSLASFICFWVLLTWSTIAALIILPIVTRLAFFDTLLNLSRKKRWLYESKSKSGWDAIERRIGLPTWVYRILYIIMYVVYLLIYFNAR